MTLNATAALAADVTFQGQIRAAALSYSLVVGAEAFGTHGQVNVKRQALAQAVIADGCVAMLQRFVWGIAATAGFSAIVNDTTNANDAAINSAIVSQYNVLAGVTSVNLANT